MGFMRTVLSPGNGKDRPKQGDIVTIDYRGCLYDGSKGADSYFMGTQFDSSKVRGPLKTPIGVGQVIKGWDEAVLLMSLGEKAILTITSDYGYGPRGFPGLIPPNSDLVFEVELKAINGSGV